VVLGLCRWLKINRANTKKVVYFNMVNEYTLFMVRDWIEPQPGEINMIGGKRAGAGRKPLPPELLKIPVLIKLPRWLLDWMRTQPESRAVLIENALQKKHKLTPPKQAEKKNEN
jgi:hypothetical protein